MGHDDKVRSGERDAGPADADRRFEAVAPSVLRRGDRVAVSFGVLTLRAVVCEGPSARMFWVEDQPSVSVQWCNTVSRLVVAVLGIHEGRAMNDQEYAASMVGTTVGFESLDHQLYTIHAADGLMVLAERHHDGGPMDAVFWVRAEVMRGMERVA